MSTRRSWREAPDAAFRKPSQEQRRDALLRLATEMFNQRGIGGTKLDDLAAGLGIRKASLYNYVASKNDLIYQCLLRTLEIRRRIMDRALEVDGDAIERLEAYLEAMIELLWGPEQLFPIMLFYEIPEEFKTSPEGKRAFKKVDKELDRLVDLFECGQSDGSMRRDDVSVLVHAFESPLFCFSRWHGLTEHPPGEQVHRTLAAFTLEGLRRRE